MVDERLAEKSKAQDGFGRMSHRSTQGSMMIVKESRIVNGDAQKLEEQME